MKNNNVSVIHDQDDDKYYLEFCCPHELCGHIKYSHKTYETEKKAVDAYQNKEVRFIDL